MRPPIGRIGSSGVVGEFSVEVHGHLDGSVRSQEITWFRGAPVVFDDFSWTDPFGPESATVTLPQVSAREPLGASSTDTWWLRIGTRIDIAFRVTDEVVAQALEHSGMGAEIVWEGYISSLNLNVGPTGDAVKLSCLGALRMLDTRLAPKTTYSRPYPYEHIIGANIDHANRQHPTGLSGLSIVWPDWWNLRYTEKADAPWYLKPAGVVEGQPWSGMTVREFGRWDAVLSSTIQGLLSVMHTERGQFTLMLARGRVPVLGHRDRLVAATESTLVVDTLWPGVTVDLNSDGGQRVNAIYGESRSAYSGATYLGARRAVDGSQAGFDPFALHHSVDPTSFMSDPTTLRNELFITFSDGLSPAESIDKARRHILVNNHPGWVGTVTLTGIDALIAHPSGEMVPYPGMMVRAGQTILLRGLLGDREGRLLSISQAKYSYAQNSVTLTVDSKFRDYMTTREIMDRGKDALRPWHMMTVGKYNMGIPDSMLPWDYSQGSGYIPWRPGAVEFWATDEVPSDMGFPWTELTTLRPPWMSMWRPFYARVPALVKDAAEHGLSKDNWNRTTVNDTSKGCELLLAQAGEISLLQICAYDEDGAVKRVPFHVSIYGSNSVASDSMPLLRKGGPGVDASDIFASYYTDADGQTKRVFYDVGGAVAHPYPFFKDAWEDVRSDGSQNNDIGSTVPKVASLFVGYGNHFEKAGYWPGTGRAEVDDFGYPTATTAEIAMPTGMLVDETGWNFDMSKFAGFDLSSRTNTLIQNANCTVLIYCESDTDTYFLGRLYRKEPGTS